MARSQDHVVLFDSLDAAESVSRESIVLTEHRHWRRRNSFLLQIELDLRPERRLDARLGIATGRFVQRVDRGKPDNLIAAAPGDFEGYWIEPTDAVVQSDGAVSDH